MPLIAARVCDSCSKHSARLLNCAGSCGGTGAKYCGKVCQKAHWPKHREFCQKVHSGNKDKQPDMFLCLGKFTERHISLLARYAYHALNLRDYPQANQERCITYQFLYRDGGCPPWTKRSDAFAGFFFKTQLWDELKFEDQEERSKLLELKSNAKKKDNIVFRMVASPIVYVAQTDSTGNTSKVGVAAGPSRRAYVECSRALACVEEACWTPERGDEVWKKIDELMNKTT